MRPFNWARLKINNVLSWIYLNIWILEWWPIWYFPKLLLLLLFNSFLYLQMVSFDFRKSIDKEIYQSHISWWDKYWVDRVFLNLTNFKENYLNKLVHKVKLYQTKDKIGNTYWMDANMNIYISNTWYMSITIQLCSLLQLFFFFLIF